MQHDNEVLITKLAQEIIDKYERDFVHPFPSKDCKKIINQSKGRLNGIMPDLNTYFYDIASPSSGADLLPKQSDELLARLQESLSQSFFDKHPDYLIAKEFITLENTPSLYKRLLVTDELRERLLELISIILSQRIIDAGRGSE